MKPRWNFWKYFEGFVEMSQYSSPHLPKMGDTSSDSDGINYKYSSNNIYYQNTATIHRIIETQ